MPRPASDAIRQFYERGGYVKPRESRGDRERRVKQALYGSSQWEREGFASTGWTGLGSRVGSWLGDLIRDVGKKQGSRLARAADETNLERFNEGALREALKRPQMGVMPPGDFEKYAAPLNIAGHTIDPSQFAPGTRFDRLYGAEFAPKGTQSYDDYIKYLQGVAQQTGPGGGFENVPILNFGKTRFNVEGQPVWQTDVHSGRHRMRALAGLGDPNALVTFGSPQHLTNPKLDLSGQLALPELWEPRLRIARDVNELPEMWAHGGRVGFKDTGWTGLLGKTFRSIFTAPATSEREKQAVREVAAHARQTGDEALIYGANRAPYGMPPLSAKIPGTEGAVDIPESYHRYMGSLPRNQGELFPTRRINQATGMLPPSLEDAAPFTVHPHPSGSLVPSTADIGVWGNKLKGEHFATDDWTPDPTQYPFGRMLIAHPGGRKLFSIPPASSSPLAKAGDMSPEQIAQGVYDMKNAQRGWTGDYIRNAWGKMGDWAQAHGVIQPQRIHGTDFGTWLSEIANLDLMQGMRNRYGLDVQLSPGQQLWGSNVKQSEIAPSALDYWKKNIGDMPFSGMADGGRVPFKRTGWTGLFEGAGKYLGDYLDEPAQALGNWLWRPMHKVAEDLGLTGAAKVSPAVENYADFMRKMAARASSEGLSPEDLMKSYAMARISMGRSAINPEPLIESGLQVPAGQMIRPEGAMAYWLRTPEGRQYLEEAAHTGKFDPRTGVRLTNIMSPFGKQNEMPDILGWGAANLPGREGLASELVERARRGASDPSEWLSAFGNMRGIKPAKQGFFAAPLGRGDLPVFDARQIIANTGLSSEEGAGRVAAIPRATAAVQRLSDRMRALNYDLPPWAEINRPYLSHHETWDRLGGEQTTHQDIIDTMLGKKRGGRIGFAGRGSGWTGALTKGAEYLGENVINPAARYLNENVVEPVEQNLLKYYAQLRGEAPAELATKLATTKEGVRSRILGEPVVGEQTKSGISSRVGSAPFENVTAAIDPSPFTPPPRTMTPESFPINSYIVGSMADLSGAGPTVRSIGGMRLPNPVQLRGGTDFPWLQQHFGFPNELWAADKGALTGITGALERAGVSPDDPVHFMTKGMGLGGIDQSNMTMEMLHQLFQGSHMSPQEATKLDNMIRSYKTSLPGPPGPQGQMTSVYKEAMPDFPGVRSEDLHDYLMSLPMGRRAALLKVLDAKKAEDLGAPSSVAVRFAGTDPAQMSVPRGMVGRTVGGFELGTPFITNPGMPHPSYPVHFPGTVQGGLDRPAPGDLIFRDQWRQLRKQFPDASSTQMTKFMNFPAVQKVTPQWQDWVMRRYEKLPPGWTPSGLARGGSVRDRELYHPTWWQEDWGAL